MKPGKIFALDIGTRKVMGLLAEDQGDGVRILDAESREHPTRAMKAGQIQDIPKVTAVVRQVAQALADRSGEPVKQAAVAVAGRNLRTILGRAALDCPADRALEARDIERVVFDALENALTTLHAPGHGESAKARYYCVGYVVSRTLLDGEALPQPCGHRGERLEAEVLASFLPWQSLESQLAVLEAAGLEASSVTLEPIAALQAVVDPGLKQFELALVDVGAGTSDIAIVGGGVVRSFGMVPCAGDFVTEALAGQFLLDFPAAEQVKRAASGGATIQTATVLQQPLELSPAEAVSAMAPAVSELARRIARCVLDLRAGQPPQMVLCVGGGSLTPGLFQELASAMGLPASRVGTRSPGLSLGLKDAKGGVPGPETATPLGIACVAAAEGGVRFQRVFFNGRRFLLLEMGRPLTVSSALMAAGVSAKDVFGWPGASKTYTVNGEFRMLRREGARPARILVNGEPAGAEDPIRDGDTICFEQGEGARQADQTVGDALGLKSLTVTVNGRVREVRPMATCRGRTVDLCAPLEDRMALTVAPVAIAQALTEEERRQGHAHCNGHLVSLETRLRDGDKIETLEHNLTELPAEISRMMGGAPPRVEPAPQAQEASEPPRPLGGPIRVRLNGHWVTIEDQQGRPVVSGRDAPPILVDVLRHVSLPAGGMAGRRLKLLVNGREAGFTSPIQHGAEVRVFFE